MEGEAIERIGRVLAMFGEFYWHPAAGLMSQEAFQRALGDWKRALGLFLGHYAFERAGRSPRYPKAAAQAILAYPHSTPQADLEPFLWREFRCRVAPQPPNERVNPLAPSQGDKVSLPALIQELASEGHNLIRWAKRGLEGGEIHSISRELQRVRGIGVKIAAFFLRDVADAFEIEVEDLNEAIWLQPIDRWTRRGAEALAPLLGVPLPRGDWDCAKVLVELGQQARVRPTLVNTGIWVLGALFAKTGGEFQEALGDLKVLKAILSRWRDEHEARLGLLETVLGQL